VGDNPGPGWPQYTIPLGVIEMPMCIDRKINVLASDLRERGFDLWHQLRKLVIHDERAALADRHADVAAESEEHVEPVGELLGFDFSRREIPAEAFEKFVATRSGLLGRGRRGEANADQDSCKQMFHGIPQW